MAGGIIRLGVVWGYRLFGGPAEVADAEGSKDCDIAKGDEDGHGCFARPATGSEGCRQDVLCGAVWGPVGDAADLYAKHPEGGELTDHDEDEEDEPGDAEGRLLVLDQANDHLAQAEIEGAAEDRRQEGEDIIGGIHYNMIDLVADVKQDKGRDDDHDELYGEAAGHDRPAGGRGDAESLEDTFIAIAGNGICIAHEADGIKTYGDAVGEREGSAELGDQSFPGYEDDRRDEDRQHGSTAVAPLGCQVCFEQAGEDRPGRGKGILRAFGLWEGGC